MSVCESSSDCIVLEHGDLIVIYAGALTPDEIDLIEDTHPHCGYCMHMEYIPQWVNLPRLHRALQDKFGEDFMKRYAVVFDDEIG